LNPQRRLESLAGLAWFVNSESHIAVYYRSLTVVGLLGGSGNDTLVLRRAYIVLRRVNLQQGPAIPARQTAGKLRRASGGLNDEENPSIN